MHQDVTRYLNKKIDEKANLVIEIAYETHVKGNYRLSEAGKEKEILTKEEIILQFIDSQADRFKMILGNIAFHALLSDFDVIGEIVKHWDDAEFPLKDNA